MSMPRRCHYIDAGPVSFTAHGVTQQFLSAQEGEPVSREVLCLHEFMLRAELLSYILFKAVKSEPVQQDLQPNTAATLRPRIRSKRPSPWSVSNSAGKEQKHWETSLHMPMAGSRMTQGVSSLLPVHLRAGMELPGEFLVAHWCLRGHRTYREGNCCKGGLERHILGISRFRQLHRNNQREKTSKAVDHSNEQPSN